MDLSVGEGAPIFGELEDLLSPAEKEEIRCSSSADAVREQLVVLLHRIQPCAGADAAAVAHDLVAHRRRLDRHWSAEEEHFISANATRPVVDVYRELRERSASDPGAFQARTRLAVAKKMSRVRHARAGAG